MHLEFIPFSSVFQDNTHLVLLFTAVSSEPILPPPLDHEFPDGSNHILLFPASSEMLNTCVMDCLSPLIMSKLEVLF